MAKWIPINSVEAGDTVIQTLPSGRSDDLTGAQMTGVRTVCTFNCPKQKMDLLQVGEVYITAHPSENYMSIYMSLNKTIHVV